MPSAKRIELKLNYIQAQNSKNEDSLGARKQITSEVPAYK